MDKLMTASVLFFLLNSIAQAEIYKWVDEDGKVHFSDRPAENSNQINLQTDSSKKSSSSSESREERRQRILQSLQEDRLAKQKLKDEEKKKQAKLSRQCNYARDALKNYQRSSRLYNLDENGNRVYMSDKSKEQTIKNLQANINKHCR